MPDYQIQTRDINDIRPYKNNAKLHPQEQIDKICKSIALTGFDQPIVINSNNVIIKGHGRLTAAKQLGLTDVPVIVLDVPDAVADKARLIDNKSGESEYDIEILLKELNKFADELPDTGFDQEELKKLTMQLEDQIAINSYDWESLENAPTIFDKKPTPTAEKTVNNQTVKTESDNTEDEPGEQDDQPETVVIRAYVEAHQAELIYEVLGIDQASTPQEVGEKLWQICQQ